MHLCRPIVSACCGWTREPPGRSRQASSAANAPLAATLFKTLTDKAYLWVPHEWRCCVPLCTAHVWILTKSIIRSVFSPGPSADRPRQALTIWPLLLWVKFGHKLLLVTRPREAQYGDNKPPWALAFFQGTFANPVTGTLAFFKGTLAKSSQAP